MKFSHSRRTFLLLVFALCAVIYGTVFIVDNISVPVRKEPAWEGPRAYLRSLQSQLHDALTERRYAEGEMLIRRILKLAPGNRNMHRTAGKIFYHNGKLGEAESVLRNQLLRHPEDLLSRNNYGMVLLARGKREAFQELKKAYEGSGNSGFIGENLRYAGKKLGLEVPAAPEGGTGGTPLFPVPPLDAIIAPEE